MVHVVDRLTTWEELIHFLSINELEHFGRYQELYEQYMQKMKNIKEEYVAVSDYVKHKILNFNVQTSQEHNNKLVSVPPPTLLAVSSANPTNVNNNNNNENENAKITKEAEDLPVILKFVPNDFPYWFEPDVEHWIIWSYPRALNNNEILATIESKFGEDLNAIEYVYWRNPTILQSIKDLEHYHVVWRRKKKQCTTSLQ